MVKASCFETKINDGLAGNLNAGPIIVLSLGRHGLLRATASLHVAGKLSNSGLDPRHAGFDCCGTCQTIFSSIMTLEGTGYEKSLTFFHNGIVIVSRGLIG